MSGIEDSHIQELNNSKVLTEIDELLARVESLRPFLPDVEGKVIQKLRLDWNYHSNAIEGNQLNYGETIALLMHGITAKGKPLKDHNDIKGHDEGIEHMMKMVKSDLNITQYDIMVLHQIILKEPYSINAVTPSGVKVRKKIKIGEYKTEPNHVLTKTGAIHYYTEPELVQAEMSDLVDWVNQALNATTFHPVVIAAVFHHRFVAIHPFDDGNGRLGRILMNLILLKYKIPPVVIKYDARNQYYGTLAQADVGNYEPLIELIAESAKRSLQIQLSAAQGDVINTIEDVDKSIAVFKAGLSSSEKGTIKKTADRMLILLSEDIIPLYEELEKRLLQFDELFEVVEKSFSFREPTHGTKLFRSTGPFAENLLTAAKSAPLNITNTSFKYTFKNFKTSSTKFSHEIDFVVTFDEFYYALDASRVNTDLSVTKTYDQVFSVIERNQFIQVLIEGLINSIEKIRR